MKTRLLVTIILSLVCLISFFVSLVWPNTLLKTFYLCSFLVMLVLTLTNFVGIFLKWRVNGYKSFVPIIICVIVFLSIILFGKEMRKTANMLKFKQNESQYEKLVEIVKRDQSKISTELSRIEVPPEYKDKVFAVLVKKNTDGILYVEILTDTGFPVKHSGYLFCANGNIDDKFKTRWPVLRKINDNWFYFAD